MARHIVQYGPEPQFPIFSQQIIQYQDQMPANMNTAFVQLIAGQCKEVGTNRTVLNHEAEQ